MAHIMTKRGSVDNVITYEHICDTATDLNQIDPKEITLGSVAIVLENGLEVYMANSKKEWISLGGVSGGSSSGATSPTVDQGTADNMILQE